jgi:hypothetical protein
LANLPPVSLIPWQITTGVIETGGKLGAGVKSRCTTGINDTGGKFATGINDTGGKIRNGPYGILRGLGEIDS